jgi:hypothetical protein
MKTQIEFICPHCKNKFEINIYPVINLQSDTDLYEDLFSLELFKIECSSCKKVTMIEYDLLVVDMYKKYVIYLCKEADTTAYDFSENNLCRLFNVDNKSEIFNIIKYMRKVYSLAELLEKLLIFDYDLNDKILVRLKKYLYDEGLVDNVRYPQLNFEKIEGQNLIFTAYNLNKREENPSMLSINFEYYNKMIDEIGKLPNENLLFEYV